MSPADPLSVLVVDDESIVRESLAGWFRDDGYRVVTATCARDALKLAADGGFQLALLDIKMPGMDGLEATLAILRRHGREAQAIGHAVADTTREWGNRLRNIQTGGINAYLYGIVIAVTIILVARVW